MYINNLLFEHEGEKLDPKVRVTKSGDISIDLVSSNYANNKSTSIAHTLILSKDTAEELSRVIMFAIYAIESGHYESDNKQ